MYLKVCPFEVQLTVEYSSDYGGLKFEAPFAKFVRYESICGVASGSDGCGSTWACSVLQFQSCCQLLVG